jgi:iron complex outermembrane recepter protein
VDGRILGNNRLWVEGIDIDNNSISSAKYTNARFSYNGEMANGATWGVSLDVTNLFDRGPPRIAGLAGQGVPGDYDIYGRRYFVTLRATF